VSQNKIGSELERYQHLPPSFAGGQVGKWAGEKATADFPLSHLLTFMFFGPVGQ